MRQRQDDVTTLIFHIVQFDQDMIQVFLRKIQEWLDTHLDCLCQQNYHKTVHRFFSEIFLTASTCP